MKVAPALSVRGDMVRCVVASMRTPDPSVRPPLGAAAGLAGGRAAEALVDRSPSAPNPTCPNTLRMVESKGPWVTVIGVAANIRSRCVLDDAPATMYFHYPQATEAAYFTPRRMVLIADRRFLTWLFAGFSVLALLLVGLGICGVIAYGASQRTPDHLVRRDLPPYLRASPTLALNVTLARKLVANVLLGILLAIGLTEAAPAQSLTLSKERLARVDQALQSWADAGAMAGAVALVLQHGKVAYQGVFGWADKETGRKLTMDAMFRIASQSKAVTSVAVMMLYEEGKIGLGDPVSRWMPTFAQTTVAVQTDTGRAIVPAKRPITIRDLLTHTAGISYGTGALVAPLYQAKGLGPAAGHGWYTADKDEPICTTMDRLGTLPFVAQPGEAFVYGYNTDILGCVIERVSGMPLDQFFAQRIFGPVGMPDTYFFVPAEKAGRLAAVYRPGAAGTLVKADEGARGQGHYAVGPRKSFAGGAGLVSTAGDYARFLQMVLNGGAINGHQLLSPTTVSLMTTNMVGTRLSPDGLGFGLGFMTVDRLGAGNNPHSVGSFGWGGAYQTDYDVDPAQDLVIVLMTQNLPGIPLDIGGRFATLVYQALVPVTAPRRSP